MADRPRRRKSGIGGIDIEERKIAGLVERSRRRKSESGSKDLLEHRRLLKELEDQDGNDIIEENDETDNQEDVEKDITDSSSSNCEAESESDDGDLDDDEKAALEKAINALSTQSKISTKQRRQRKGLNSKTDPSPYMNKCQKGLSQVRTDTLINSGKGSSTDLEALANKSQMYTKSSSLSSTTSDKKSTKKSNIVTSGDGWFNLPATEMTDELKQDLRAVRMRGALDPKRFYKAFDRPSKFVQVGTIIEGRDEYHTSRLTRKQRRTNLVDELMADERTRQYTKRKFGSIQADKQNRKRFGPKKKTSKILGNKPKSNNK